MFIRSAERVYTNLPNYMTLEGRDGFWYLVHRNYYDAALILADRYSERYEAYAQEVGGNQSLPAIQEFFDNVPEPLNILAPFLGLINDDRAQELTGDLDVQVGAICIIGMQIALRKFLNVKKEIRQSAIFTMSIASEYTKAKDQFLASCLTSGENTINATVSTPGLSKKPVTNNVTTPSTEDVDIGDDEDDEDDFDFPELAIASIVDPSDSDTGPETSSAPVGNSKHAGILGYINGGV